MQIFELGAGGKPSTWFPPGGCRANTATERKRTNRRTNQQTKNQQKIWQITRHIAILFGGLRLGGSVAWWRRGSVAWWFSGSSFGAFVTRRPNDTGRWLDDLMAYLGSVVRPRFDRVRCLAECLWSSMWHTATGNCFFRLNYDRCLSFNVVQMCQLCVLLSLGFLKAVFHYSIVRFLKILQFSKSSPKLPPVLKLGSGI